MGKKPKKAKYRIYTSYFAVAVLFGIGLLSVVDIYLVPENYLFLFLFLGMMVLWQNLKSVLVLILSVILIFYVSTYSFTLTILGGIFLYMEVKKIDKEINKIFYEKYTKDYKLIDSKPTFIYSSFFGLILYGDFYKAFVEHQSEIFEILIDFKNRKIFEREPIP